MSTLELLLAFQLRSLAADLRSAARANFYAGIFDNSDEAQRREKLAEWDREHPINRFVPMALQEVEEVADHVRDLLRDS
ncbi:hypothetical protein [Massilia sp. TN1-12]|uniref:hypothetical protein n=1 Tax=Massilia paldalensis TaxID=3377675 RepID=UPI00384C0323